jgi:hypothetical protein
MIAGEQSVWSVQGCAPWIVIGEALVGTGRAGATEGPRYIGGDIASIGPPCHLYE